MVSLAPFENESQVVSVGGLSLENRTDRISISGNVELTRDKVGLDHARKLRNLLAMVVARLEAESGLSESVATDQGAVSGRRDPFG